MATILFYSPFNNRSRDTESLMISFKEQGHTVISLNQSEGKFIHPFLAEKGILTYSFFLKNSKGLSLHVRHFLYFIRFCFKHNVDIVYSHLEPANFIASLGQFFISAKVYICRHHGDMFNFGFNKPGIAYTLTYRLARKIIVVSNATKNYMIKHEGVKESKIIVIPLAYDFGLYKEIDHSFVTRFRNEITADFLIITVGQLIPIKQPDVSIRVLKRVIDAGINAKLVLVGSGIMEQDCRLLASELNIQDRVVFTGFVPNVLDYISASDILFHPSVTESSCVVVKEAGLVEKPIIARKGVGDFDDYIVSGENGFLLEERNFLEAAALIIIDSSANGLQLKRSLKEDVKHRFGIENVIGHYEPLNKL